MSSRGLVLYFPTRGDAAYVSYCFSFVRLLLHRGTYIALVLQLLYLCNEAIDCDRLPFANRKFSCRFASSLTDAED